MLEQKIVDLVREFQIEWSNHVVRRMLQRGISREEVLECLLSDEIIEEYPSDFPFPSYLILGYYGDKPLHIVCSVGQGKLWIITVYRPSTDRWFDDFKTRRR
ncbi:TPA: DUF4258 domain-containing protein [Candidatus Poribacteria bacterium]|nr:DUF4258 domain-containing protein [Candidatus Poribacteria bacterium]HEX30573.1 DUF4258 domain-containing protein [Candidatus Poribacteria bacterium]